MKKHITKFFQVLVLVLVHASFFSLQSMAQAPTWISSKIENSFSQPSPNVFQSKFKITFSQNQPGDSPGAKLFVVVYNVRPSTAPTAQQIEQYVNGSLTPPASMVERKMVEVARDSVTYAPLTSALPENKRYYTYMAIKGNLSGLYSSVKYFAKYLFRAQRSPNSYYYVEYLPAGYNTSQKYPIMIFLHGNGEVGTQISDLQKVITLGPPRRIFDGKNLPFIVITPRTTKKDWDVRALDAFIEELKTKYSIESKQIYLTGLSLGGVGTWNYAQRHPDKLAAIIPISGKSTNSAGMACNISKLPTWAFHDDPDGVLATSGTINMENAINACAGKITPLVTLFKIFNADGSPKPTHSCWNIAYSDKPSPANTSTRTVVERPVAVADGTTVYSWLLTHKRTALGPLVNVEADKSISTSSTTLSATVTHPEPTSSITSYQWTKLIGPTVTMNGTTSPSVSLSNLVAGSYRFRLTVKDSKGYMDTDEVVLTVTSTTTTLSTDESSLEAGKVIAYPNPGDGKMSVSLPGESGEVNFTITDITGRVFSHSKARVSDEKAELDIRNLSNGMYLIKVNSANYKNKVVKFIKE